MNKLPLKLIWTALAILTVVTYQNCAPTKFTAMGEMEETLPSGLSVLSPESCGQHASGSRWWEVDPNTETASCPGGSSIELRYQVEKLCDNGTITLTGQRITDSSNPTCPSLCQSQTAPWNVEDGIMQQVVNCPGSTTAVEIHERLVQYTCVNGSPQATGTISPGDLVAGGCPAVPTNPCVNSTNGQMQSEGTIWQEPIADYTYSQACEGSSVRSQHTCDRFIEYQCLQNMKQLTNREVVTLNCQQTVACPVTYDSCSSESGTHPHLSTWTRRIAPDFSDPGNCTAGGDLFITSERLQTYQCNDGNVIAQQVVRGATIGQTGQCGPRACSYPNGTGRQNWISTTSQWGACEPIACNSGYELLQRQCLANCASNQVRNPTTLACETLVCSTAGESRSCPVQNGTGSQTCSSDRLSWGSCVPQTCNAGYILRGGSCILAKTINVISADYGRNFGHVNNATWHVAASCNGQYGCNYFITTSNLGDPRVGWSKDFYVLYDCRDGVTRSVYANPEANQQTITLSCPAQ